MKYRRKQEEIDAIQFLDIKQVHDFTGKSIDLEEDEHGQFLSIHGFEGIKKCRKLDWIVKNKLGSFQVIPQYLFLEMFEEIK